MKRFVGLLLAVLLAAGLFVGLPVARAVDTSVWLFWEVQAEVGCVFILDYDASFQAPVGTVTSPLGSTSTWSAWAYNSTHGGGYGSVVVPIDYGVQTISCVATIPGLGVVNWSGSVNVPVDSWNIGWVEITLGDLPPLSVSIAGAFTMQVGALYTCTATADGGTPPYRYLWAIDWVTVIGGVNNYTAVYTGALTSSGTFTYTFTFVGEFLIRVTALDAEDSEATDTLDLNAGVNKPELWGQIYDIPDGDALKTYLNFKLFPPTTPQGSPPISGDTAIGTSNYSVTSPGTVEQGSNYYMLSPVLITALPNPLLVYVNYRDPVSKQTWSYVFSFDTTGWAAGSGALSNGDTWTGAETPGAFAWLWDLLVKLFRFLFVPSSTDFSAQIASGWVLITSPVPTITPQYTIPFPNPDHLLAPTGDSVNIDFSAISTWTYYATVKALVQVFLYAILVFIVIGIVT